MRNIMACNHTCRSCIVDALSSCSSRCPDCNHPGWLNDLKSNRQLSNMVQLLTSMKKQVSPAAFAVTTFVSDNNQSKPEVFDGTSSSEITLKSDGNRHEYSSLFIKPRVDACLIQRHLKSSKVHVVEEKMPRFSDEMESMSAIDTCNSSKRASIKKVKIGIGHSFTKVQGVGLLKHKKQQSIHHESNLSTAVGEFLCSCFL